MSKAFDLFSGSQSFANWFRSKGGEVWTLDILDIQGAKPDFIRDYMDMDIKKDPPFVPDIIWASPDCAAFSIAAASLHFDSSSNKPKTEKAEKAIRLIEKLIEDIKHILSINPECRFYIENPVGKLQFLECMKPGFFNPIPNFKVWKIDQCQYGREFKKPTHIFTNATTPFNKILTCKHPDKCHHYKGAGGLSDCFSTSKGKTPSASAPYYQRAKIPFNLFENLIEL